MNFEELKDIWQNEEVDASSFKLKLEKLNDYNSPMISLKKNLKIEFFLTWGTIVFLIIMSSISNLGDKNLYNWFFLNIIVCTTIYYHIIFYKFYRKNMIQGINTYHNLIEFITEFKYSIHLYRSFNYIIMLVLAPIIFNLLEFLYPKLFNDIINTPAILILITIYLLFVIFVCEVWIYSFYSQSLKKLQALLNQIETVEK